MSVIKMDKMLSYFDGPIVTFTVGDDDTQRFHIHRGLVASSSVVFEDMLREFKSDYSPDICLEEVSPKVFAIFAHWLYKECLPELEEDTSAITLCLEAFVFADAYSVLPFKQLIHDKIKERRSNPGLPPKKIVRELFSYGDVTKSLQEILVEFVTKKIYERTVPQDTVEWLNSTRGEIPKFSMDVAESLTRRILTSAPPVNQALVDRSPVNPRPVGPSSINPQLREVGTRGPWKPFRKDAVIIRVMDRTGSLSTLASENSTQGVKRTIDHVETDGNVLNGICPKKEKLVHRGDIEPNKE